MKKNILIFFLILLTLSACNLPAGELATVTATSEAIPEITSGAPTVEPTLAALQLAVHPPQTRTGQNEIDPIIDALLAHDFPAIKILTAYQNIGCTNQDGLGGPPKCTADEQDGTVVEVVPFLGPEGHHLRRVEFENWEGPDVLGLLAVYRTSSGTYTDPAYPGGDFGLVFLLSSDAEVLTLQVRDGLIIRYDYHFGGLSEKDLAANAGEILLPLTFRPIPTAVPWNPFLDPAGRFSFVYPPPMELIPGDFDDSWQLGDRIKVEVLSFERSWISCFYQSMGDCPSVEIDQIVKIQNREVRRVEGYIGAVGGNIPQEFLTYIFNLGENALVMTVYALPFGTQSVDISQIWPLGGMELDLFERTVNTVIIQD